MDPAGDEVPYLLHQNDELLSRVSDWYRRELRVDGFDVEFGGTAFSLALRGRSEEGPNIARAGQGLQQVLPVVVFLSGMAAGLLDFSFLTIEEPELHLHPAAHGAVADLAIEAANARQSNQVLIETHSENLVLRLRRRVAEGALRPSQLNLLWFDHSDPTGATVRQVGVQDDGSVDHWPSGVFAEDYAEVQGMIRARA